jgi:5-methylcytosine-specific restriction endonuclease McrA
MNKDATIEEKAKFAAYMKEYLQRPEAKERARLRKAKYREANRDRLVQAETARYYENRDTILVERQAARDNNREAVRTYHREYCRGWREKNRESLRAYFRDYTKQPYVRIQQYQHKAKRRALEIGTAVGPINYAEILESGKGKCGICRQPIYGGKFHFDHVIPLARGGSHTQDNLQIAHPSCNQSKGAKLESELS